MRKSSAWYRLLLIAILATGFLVSTAEGITKQYLADHVSSYCEGYEVDDNEVDPLEPIESLLQDFALIEVPVAQVMPVKRSARLASTPKLFLLYQQWKLHC